MHGNKIYIYLEMDINIRDPAKSLARLTQRIKYKYFNQDDIISRVGSTEVYPVIHVSSIRSRVKRNLSFLISRCDSRNSINMYNNFVPCNEIRDVNIVTRPRIAESPTPAYLYPTSSVCLSATCCPHADRPLIFTLRLAMSDLSVQRRRLRHA